MIHEVFETIFGHDVRIIGRVPIHGIYKTVNNGGGGDETGLRTSVLRQKGRRW